MEKGINVLAPFNGCSGAMLALRANNIPIKTYVSLETDKYANTVSQANWGNTVWQMGDVREFSEKLYRESYLEKHPFDLLIGGSPCQDVSFAGHQKGLVPGTRSSLFFEYVRLLEQFKPKYFLLENVRMKQENQDIISEALGVQPIKINSSLLTAQNRVRYYWTNIPQSDLPDDKGVVLQDILEDDGYSADRDKSFCIDANYFKGGNLKSYFEKHRRQLVFSPEGLAADKPMWRKLLPLEVERLQGMPDNYTAHVSNTQRYRMVGNGFTIPVISHLLKGMRV